MAKFKVTAQALNAAADKFIQYAAEYENASNTAHASARELARRWEGDAQKAFVAEQERTFNWYRDMALLVRAYASAMKAAAKAYEAAEAAATAAMKG